MVAFLMNTLQYFLIKITQIKIIFYHNWNYSVLGFLFLLLVCFPEGKEEVVLWQSKERFIAISSFLPCHHNLCILPIDFHASSLSSDALSFLFADITDTTFCFHWNLWELLSTKRLHFLGNSLNWNWLEARRIQDLWLSIYGHIWVRNELGLTRLIWV